MSPITHFLAGWVVANTANVTPRDRILVTLAGVAPDVDALGLIAELATRNTENPLNWWSDYHHVLGHNLGFGLIIALLVFWLSVRRTAATLLTLAAFHLHLLCDLVGSRGPDGYQWPIPYLLPFSERLQLVWTGQWALNAWPNLVFTSILLGISLYLAWVRGYSPFECISKSANSAFVSTLKKRFG
jgi:inner membrane protein